LSRQETEIRKSDISGLLTRLEIWLARKLADIRYPDQNSFGSTNLSGTEKVKNLIFLSVFRVSSASAMLFEVRFEERDKGTKGVAIEATARAPEHIHCKRAHP